MNGRDKWYIGGIATSFLLSVGISWSLMLYNNGVHGLQPHRGAVSRAEYVEDIREIKADIREIRQLLERRAQ